MPLVQSKERIRGSDGKALHPTQKPEEMLKRIILASRSDYIRGLITHFRLLFTAI
jgi:site-specific DNA-methyltransferase (adenine-specific)/modification methylase